VKSSRLFVLSILLCACSQGDTHPANIGDCPPVCEGGTSDAKSPVDGTTPSDASNEAAPTLDAGTDTGGDAGTDAGGDATLDAGADASIDSPDDATGDATDDAADADDGASLLDTGADQ
jgi:hypothetical protein